MRQQVWQQTKRGITMRLRVAPGAKRNGIAGIFKDANGQVSLKVATTAQPEKGKANKAVIAILSKQFHQAKSKFSVIVGQTDRNKTILIDGEIQDIKSWLLPALERLKND